MVDAPLRVLLVEEDVVDQIAFKRLVSAESLPYDYVTAGSIAEARRHLAAEPFDVIILDYRLGDGAAFDLSDSFAPGVPIIMTTSPMDTTIAVHAMQTGAVDYLVKDPDRYYLHTLPAAVNQAVRRHRAELALLASQAQVLQLNAELERRLVERTTQLVAANKELEAFSYSVSHDLRAPLRSIDGFTTMVIQDYSAQLDEQAQRYLQRVRASTKAMGQLIDGLVDLSRYGRSQLNREPVSLSGLANSIAADLRATQPEREVRFVIAAGVVVSGDARLLSVVMTNLLGNAWKFTGKTPQARIEFDSGAIDGERFYFVRDNGAGFNGAYAHKLFGAFQRLHTVREFPGIGIGLATVQRIVVRHGGRVWAVAAVDQGATFYFTLPLG